MQTDRQADRQTETDRHMNRGWRGGDRDERRMGRDTEMIREGKRERDEQRMGKRERIEGEERELNREGEERQKESRGEER